MTILVVEDEPDIQSVLRMTLEFVGKHVVTVVDTGEKALATAQSLQPDLILLDVMMPKMDGYETLRRLKQNDATSAIPVVFLTAKAQEKEVQHGLSLGALGYITKPFDPIQLNKTIQECLERAE
ncbi:MAG: response regulator [Candidatus Poribacteria bacterium]|nr:response regulator [Candidatus Poribacteria bacterium]